LQPGNATQCAAGAGASDGPTAGTAGASRQVTGDVSLGLSLLAALHGLDAFASGGAVHGPGTNRSDSRPAWLSTGEHVLSARGVDNLSGHEGVDAVRRPAAGYPAAGPVVPRFHLLTGDSFNRAPRFASGGAVSFRGGVCTSEGGPRCAEHHSVSIDLPPSLVAKHMESAGGPAAAVRAAVKQRTRYAVRTEDHALRAREPWLRGAAVGLGRP
jgi:hypothetical protein